MSSHPVYTSEAAVRAVIGVPNGQDERLQLAIVTASRFVDYKLGRIVTDEDLAVVPPVELADSPAPAGIRSATTQLAVRFWRSPDVVLGIAGGMGDLAVRVNAFGIQDLELLLHGHREAWGIA